MRNTYHAEEKIFGGIR